MGIKIQHHFLKLNKLNVNQVKAYIKETFGLDNPSVFVFVCRYFLWLYQPSMVAKYKL